MVGGLQRSISMENAAQNIVSIDPEEREQQQLLDTLMAPDDPYALVDGTREGVRNTTNSAHCDHTLFRRCRPLA